MAFNELYIIAENNETLALLSGLGKALNLTIKAITLKAGLNAAAYGAEQVWTVESPASGLVEDNAPAIADLLQGENASLVATAETPTGRLIAGRLAAKLNAGLITNITSLDLLGEQALAKRSVLGGMAVESKVSQSQTTIITLAAGAFEPAEADASRTATETVVPAAADSGIRLVEEKAHEGEKVDLTAAKRVVSIGRGFAKEEDLDLAKNLASALDAELACSRPVAEGVGWMAKERYIGVTGVKIKPNLYIALGISGQIQHMTGVEGAKTIVAVNKDKNAPVFANADFGIVGDLYTVLPKLTEQLKGL